MKIKIITPLIEKLSLVPEFSRVIPEERIYEDDHEMVNLASSGRPLIFAGISGHSGLIKNLEQLYAERIKPSAIVFDNPYSPKAFAREIYLKQNLHIFRHIPLILLNCGDNSPLVEKINVLAVNGSPREYGNTKRMLNEEVEKFWTGPYYKSEIVSLENIQECLACGGHQKNCVSNCRIEDQMKELIPKLKDADVLLLGSPVYMDLPTARTIAFLSRLTGQTKFNRRAYVGKQASSLASAYCSGTKAVISAMNNALEMIGFDIQGRSSREYVELWHDKKTRGGVPDDYYWPK